jgi:hypothetical protein
MQRTKKIICVLEPFLQIINIHRHEQQEKMICVHAKLIKNSSKKYLERGSKISKLAKL